MSIDFDWLPHLIRNSNLKFSVLEYLRERLKDPNLNPSYLLTLIKSNGVYDATFFEVRYLVARHALTPPEALELLSKDKEWGIRCLVAQHHNTPLHVLEVLAKDEKQDVRDWVAKNPTYLQTLKSKPVNTLDEEFDKFLDRMQEPGFREKMKAAFRNLMADAEKG